MRETTGIIRVLLELSDTLNLSHGGRVEDGGMYVAVAAARTRYSRIPVAYYV